MALLLEKLRCRRCQAKGDVNLDVRAALSGLRDLVSAPDWSGALYVGLADKIVGDSDLAASSAGLDQSNSGPGWQIKRASKIGARTSTTCGVEPKYSSGAA